MPEWSRVGKSQGLSRHFHAPQCDEPLIKQRMCKRATLLRDWLPLSARSRRNSAPLFILTSSTADLCLPLYKLRWDFPSHIISMALGPSLHLSPPSTICFIISLACRSCALKYKMWEEFIDRTPCEETPLSKTLVLLPGKHPHLLGHRDSGQSTLMVHSEAAADQLKVMNG